MNNIITGQGPNFITGFVAKQIAPGQNYRDIVSRITASNDDSNAIISERLLDLSWLEACSPIYKISPDPNNYSFGVVRALVVDLPNRNGHCFEMDELLKFDAQSGKQIYHTFEGKPLLVNHKYDLPKASGVLVASRLIQDGPYVAVELVVGADKGKNAKVANRITAGEASFSMGANCTHFNCSVCGSEFTLDKPDTHCKPTSMLKPQKGGALAYAIVRNPNFIEHSYLDGENPADPRALHADQSIL